MENLNLSEGIVGVEYLTIEDQRAMGLFPEPQVDWEDEREEIERLVENGYQ